MAAGANGTKMGRKLLIVALKVGISLALVGYLAYSVQDNRVFGDLWSQPKRWEFLVAALLACAAATVVSIVRWGYLVRALEIPFPLKESLRLGFLGYLFNLAPMGIVGGDVLKAVLLALRHPGNQAKAVASVIVDRIMGLYVMFVVASLAILATRFYSAPVPEIRQLSLAALGITLLGTLVIAALLTPHATDNRLIQTLERLPKVGPHLQHAVESLRMYRRRPRVLWIATAMSFGVHILLAIGVFCIACGLPGEHLSLPNHLVVVPLSFAAGVIPLPLGPTEWVLDLLYRSVPLPDGSFLPPGQGLIVTLAYRAICVTIAIVGVGYYLTGRREVSAVLHQSQQGTGTDRGDLSAGN